MKTMMTMRMMMTANTKRRNMTTTVKVILGISMHKRYMKRAMKVI
jgi:hypothetical protein